MASIGPQIPAHLLQPSQSHPESAGPGSHVDVHPSTVDPMDPQASCSAAPRQPEKAPPELRSTESEDDDDYTPALPPELAASKASAHTAGRRVFGPALGPALPRTADDSDEDIGPIPLPVGRAPEKRDAVSEFIEREERRRKAIEEAARPKALKRDEWMLAPPSSSDLLSKIDPTRMNKPRQFSRSTAPPRTTDTTLWTETPAERQQRLADEVMGKRRRQENADDGPDTETAEDARKRRKRDAQLRRQVEEHTKTHRGFSLVDAHADKEARKIKDQDDEPSAIWDHSRDMSTGGKLMDERDRQKMIRDAKGLSDRFGAGSGGGFL